jgi:RNA polymerase sigma-70 factor (ECF subfamily)
MSGVPDSPFRPQPATQADLAARVQQGDHAAFESLFRAHYDGLVRFANRLIAERMEAEELVQDVMLKVWIRRDRLRAGDDLKTYLYRATRNRALNHLRRRRVERLWSRSLPPEEPATPPQAPGGEDVTVIAAAIRAAIDALPERCREVFVLSREHELTYAAIAETMGISVKTVETQMGRALKSLRAALEPLRER